MSDHQPPGPVAAPVTPATSRLCDFWSRNFLSHIVPEACYPTVMETMRLIRAGQISSALIPEGLGETRV
jgi:hypothetical protein